MRNADANADGQSKCDANSYGDSDCYCNTNSYGDGDSYSNRNSYADSNDDSSSVAHAYSDGATTDNTYTTAPSNAGAAPVASLITLCGNSRSDSRVPARCQRQNAFSSLLL